MFQEIENPQNSYNLADLIVAAENLFKKSFLAREPRGSS